MLGRHPSREIGRMRRHDDLDTTLGLTSLGRLRQRLLGLNQKEVENQHLQLRMQMRLRLFDEE